MASGQSLSEFALSHLIDAAREVVDKATTTQLSRRDRDALLALIAEDAEPNEALKTAAERFGRRGA